MEKEANKESLKEWALHFIRQKDVSKSIISIKEEGDKIIVNQKDGQSCYFIIPEIKDELFMRGINKEDKVGIVIFNKKSNLDFLVDNWKDFIDFPFLTFYFVNPESQTDVKWIVRPSVHNRIAEQKTLKSGLKSMFEMVEEVK